MRLARGQIVKVEFSDHVDGGSKSMTFVVYGRLAGITRRELVVDAWDYKDVKKPFDKTNETRFTIVRSAIHNITRLIPHPGDKNGKWCSK